MVFSPSETIDTSWSIRINPPISPISTGLEASGAEALSRSFASPDFSCFGGVCMLRNGDDPCFVLQELVSPYALDRLWSGAFMLSESEFQSFFDPHGSATEVTIQFPAISESGDGRLIPALYGPIQIASPSCAVSVGIA